jgi:hypothetical protein
MSEVLFISDQYIKKYTQVNGSVDPNLLYPSIILAQEKYLMPYLGTKLYMRLKDDIENNTLAGNYLLLMDQYVRKVVLWSMMVEALPFLTYKIDNGSLVQRSPEDSQGVDDAVLKEFMDRAQVNADFYRGLLTDYLCANSSLFPEFSTNVFPDRYPITPASPSSAYVISSGNTYTSRSYGTRRIDQIP